MDLKALLINYFYFLNLIQKETPNFEAIKKTKNCRNVPEFILSTLNLQAEKEKTYLETPARIQWEVTNRCNLQCSHCYIDSNKDSYEVSTQDCINFINEFRKNNILRVEVQGGEPFLRHDIFEILGELKKNHIPYKILTNGTQINKKYALNLLSVLNHTTDYLQISLDGSNKKINDLIRPVGSYDKIINAIKLCRDLGVPFNVNFTINDNNVNDLFNTYKKVNEINGACRFTFFTLMNVGRGVEIKYTKHVEALNEIQKIYSFYKENGGVEASGSIGYIMHLPHYYELLSTLLPKGFMFSSLRYLSRSSMNVNHRGDCFPASYLQKNEFNGGNLKELSLIDIWHTKTWEPLRKSLDEFPLECNNCRLFNYCTKGSPAATYSYFQTFNKVDPHCKYYYSESHDNDRQVS